MGMGESRQTRHKKRSSRHNRKSTSSTRSRDAAAAASSGACGFLNSCKPAKSAAETTEASVTSPKSSKKDKDSGGRRNNRSKDDYAVYPTKSGDRLGIDSFTYQCEGASTDVVYRDHHSLPHHSNSVRYQASNVRIFEQDRSQIVLEEQIVEHDEEDEEEGGAGIVLFGKKKTREITVKKVDDAALIDYGLKSIYVLVCVMFGSLLFVSCLQILLFLFLGALPETNNANYPQQSDIINIAGAIISLPGFVYGFSSIMTLASAFTVDNWRSNRVLEAVSKDYSASNDIGTAIFAEWVSLFVFILVPATAMIVTLFMGLDDWWAYTLVAWYTTVFIFWAYYATAVLRYETTTCLDLLRKTTGCDLTSSLFYVVKRAVLIRQTHAYSGYLSSTYTIHGDQELPKAGSFTLSRRHDAERESRSLYTKLTLTACCSRQLYTQLDMPVPMKSLSDMMGVSPMITSKSWSLDKLYCRSGSKKSVLVVNGPGAVTSGQRKSSFAFAIIGNLLVLLLLVAFLIWLKAGVATVVVVVGIATLSWVPSIVSGMRTKMLYAAVKTRRREIKRVGSGILRNKEDIMNQSEAIYQVFERSRITIPSDGICWTFFVVEFALFFVIPSVIFFFVGNLPVAILFLIISACSGLRRFLSPTVILKEMGSFDHLTKTQGLRIDEAEGDGNELSVESQIARQREEYVPKARASKILGSITHGNHLKLWRFIFFTFSLVIVIVALSAVYSSSGSSEHTSVSQQLHDALPDFEYRARPYAYPTCNLPPVFRIPGKQNSMSDIAFLSNLAYEATESHAQDSLDQWFGSGEALNENGIVESFKDAWGDTSLHYKLINFSKQDGYAVVSIRGAVRLLDTLNGFRLWSAAAFAQMIRVVMPFGNMWTPILKKMVIVISLLEMHAIEEASLYKETRAFVQTLISSGEFKNVVLTGHGLGGGLALVTGAQNNFKAVGLSAPNVLLSGSIMNPPISEDELNRNTFNIVPDRDVVARIDDRANLYQEIECRAGKNSLFGCHDPIRSLCEIQYKCGSGGRPVLCACALWYGYDEPVALGNRTFSEACRSQ